MSNIAYVSTKNEVGIMSCLSMTHIQAEESFDSLIRELKYRQFQIVFVSEEVYQKHQKAIDRVNTDLSISIHVLASPGEVEGVGKQRFQALSEDAVGFSGQ